MSSSTKRSSVLLTVANATVAPADQVFYVEGRYASVTLKVTSLTGTTPTLDLVVRGVDVDGTEFAFATFAQKTGAATERKLLVDPAAQAGNGELYPLVFRKFKLDFTGGGTITDLDMKVILDQYWD